MERGLFVDAKETQREREREHKVKEMKTNWNTMDQICVFHKLQPCASLLIDAYYAAKSYWLYLSFEGVSVAHLKTHT